jgi:phosphodiesterase/alkaline phosphatase D-like protein
MSAEGGSGHKPDSRPGRLRTAARFALCASLASFALAAFPSLASAFVPLVTGVSATPTSDGATLNATIYPYGLDTHYRFEYGPTMAYGTSIPVPDGDAGAASYPETVQVHQTVTGLALNTTYHYRLVAQSSAGSATGPETADKTFTTLASPPSVVANAAAPTAAGFELSGTVNPHGADAKYRFEYGTTMSYGTNVPVPDGDAGAGSAAAPVSEEVENAALLPNTTYHFRLVAQNTGGSTPSADRTFTTPPSAPAAPSAVVNPPEPIAGGYRLKGAVNPNSLDTAYHFEFGATTGYGVNLPVPDEDVGEGASAVAVSQDVTTGLAPNTTYHYRLVASNSDGPGASADQSFTTPPEPPEVVATPFSETAAGFELNGAVNPNGGDTTYHFEFGFTTAYGSDIPAADVDAGSGTAAVQVSQLVTGLPPNVVYHYRLVAHNAGGASTSGDQEFITPPAASIVPATPAPLLPPSPAPAQPPPSSRLTVMPAVVKGAAATLRVSVPGPGTVSASGRRLRAASASSSGAGPVTLRLKLTGAGLRALKKARRHRLEVTVEILFQPTGGSPGATSRTVIFKG